MISARRCGSSIRSITKGHGRDKDSGSEEEEEGKGKERLIKLRDTGDDNEMVAVREVENEEKEETEHHKEK
jgi:hypothetical protein